MTLEDNKAVVRRFIQEVFVEGREDAADVLLAPDFRPHTWASVEPGIESFKATMRRMATLLSDVEMAVEDVIAEADRVAVRLTSTATVTDELMGVPAAGKQYSISEIHVFRLREGRISEHWHVADLMTMMRQLGAFPEPARPGG
jgi:steroid delta-isomerase-like uncharacterized protein